MEELLAQLSSVLDTYFTVLPEKSDDAQHALRTAVDNMFDSFGACSKCYGKGYLLDLWNTPDYNDLNKEIVVKPQYCDCDRGKRLAEIVDLIQHEVTIK